MKFYFSPVLAFFDENSAFWVFFEGFLQTLMTIAFIALVIFLYHRLKNRGQRKVQRMLDKAFKYIDKGLFEKAYIQHARYMDMVETDGDDYYRAGVFCQAGEEAGWTPPETNAKSSYWYALAAKEGNKWARFLVAREKFRASLPGDPLLCAKIIKEMKGLGAEGVADVEDFLKEAKQFLTEQTNQNKLRTAEAIAILDGEEYWYLCGKLFLEEGNRKDGLRWLQMAAENGNAKACVACGKYYSKGTFDIPQDNKKAMYWYEKAAECGDETDICYLAQLYAEGEICEKDLPKAGEWYTKAGDKGIAEAYWNAAVCYYKYAQECEDKKAGVKKKEELDKERLTYLLMANFYAEKAEEKGYKPGT